MAHFYKNIESLVSSQSLLHCHLQTIFKLKQFINIGQIFRKFESYISFNVIFLQVEDRLMETHNILPS